MSVADEIEKLAHLRASGALTEEEFQRAKGRLLDENRPRLLAASGPGRALLSARSIRCGVLPTMSGWAVCAAASANSQALRVGSGASSSLLD